MTADAREAELRRQAIEFAEELTETVRAVVPGAAPFRVSGATDIATSRLFVRQDPADGIVLTVETVPMLRLEVSFQCTFDHRQSFLAVEQSGMTVSAIGSSEPVLRYEYFRSAASTQAGAHLHVHAHRDALSHVMAKCGTKSARAKRRAKAADEGRRLPQLSDLHLPLGGSRYRPCLEDLLQMLIDELGVDAPAGVTDALSAGRATWRRKQLGAAVRDSPEKAAEVLEELGYSVVRPAVIPRERIERLTSL